ncbi:MAG: hypothetical protein ACI8W8_005121, partial [Rhodothermales bacterium]
DSLKQQGLADNTVVIYTADNGYYRAERGFAGKWSHFEQSQRVPLIIYDPRSPKQRQGKLTDSMVLNIDMPSTMLDLAGVDIPASWQGRSLKPILEGMTPSDWREDFFCEHLMGNRSIPMWEGVRGTRFKYARYFQQDPPYEFLHDLKTDPDELRNLIDDPEYGPVLEKLRQRSDEYVKAYSRPDRPAEPRPRSSQMQKVTPHDSGVYHFEGNGYALLANTEALSPADSFTWRFDVRVLPDNPAGAVLLGNRQTPGKPDLNFIKVTAQRGVQLFGGSNNASLRLKCELPTNQWTTVEVRKVGAEVTVSLDGELQSNGKAPFALVAMPCYLGGDPKVTTESARCEIRNAFAGKN